MRKGFYQFLIFKLRLKHYIKTLWRVNILNLLINSSELVIFLRVKACTQRLHFVSSLSKAHLRAVCVYSGRTRALSRKTYIDRFCTKKFTNQGQLNSFARITW